VDLMIRGSSYLMSSLMSARVNVAASRRVARNWIAWCMIRRGEDKGSQNGDFKGEVRLPARKGHAGRDIPMRSP
jgi:hypothetical protein